MTREQLDSAAWHRLVDQLGGEAALTASARELRAFVRARGVRSAVDLLRLALLYGPGGYSLRRLAATAASYGLADVSDVAILDRLRRAADWLQSLCATHLSGLAGIESATAPQRPIRIVDSSRLEGPGGRVWRLHLCYDARQARIVDAAITTTRVGERLDLSKVSKGEIRLGDRGYPQPDGIRNTLAEGADILVRLTWNSLRLTDPDGTPIDWLALFAEAGRRGTLDLPVLVHKAHRTFEPLALRLVVIRKPPEAAAQARAKARRASRKNQRRTDPRTLAGADHLVLLTSLDQAHVPAEELAALYRVRWQIELAFKRLKSILHIDRLPAKDPDLARAWLHAHLLLALLVDDTIAALGALSPSGGTPSSGLDVAPGDTRRRRRAREHRAAA